MVTPAAQPTTIQAAAGSRLRGREASGAGRVAAAGAAAMTEAAAAAGSVRLPAVAKV
jgi:hypothetical protein